ncbi:MAG: PaaI family thioesterase [Myxococcota bacterium]
MSEKPTVERAFTHWDAMGMSASGSWAQNRRLAVAMRRVIDGLVRIDAPEDELRLAAEALERYAERLARHPKRMRPPGYTESVTSGDPAAFFDYSPLIGRSNPLAPPVTMRAAGREVHGTVTFGAAYEGPPGCVHGGIIAAAFDEVLGYAQALTGNPGMTGTLQVRYRSPTPLATELRFEARVTRTERRKNFAEGRLQAGDTLCAEAEAVFITLNRERFLALAEAQAKRAT